MFRAATLALHSQQPAFGSFMAGPPDVHQAAPMTYLASSLGFSRSPAGARANKPWRVYLPCECEIFAGSMLGLQ